MTEENSVASEVVPVVETPVTPEPVVETPPPVQEKMVRQSEVSNAIKLAKRDSERKGYERAKREFEERQVQNASSEQSQSQPASSIGGIVQQTPEQIRQMIYEEARRLAADATAEKIVQDYEGKVAQTKEKYPDAAEKIDKLKLDRHPNLVMWLNGMDNTGDVLKDIAENPEKVAQILMLASSGLTEAAQDALLRISASIKANEEAKKQPQAPDPLGQIKPSAISTDNGSLSVSDFRKQSWLRK
jgi:hypothetical protein